MLVKICGITSLETARTVCESGADFIGFVFTPSKRRIAPIDAAHIAAQLPATIKKVGVFVDESKENIEFIAEKVGLDYIQLHGTESPAFAKALSLPVIKAFPIDEVNRKEIENYPCDYYLVDSPVKQLRGGSGEVFDWKVLNDLQVNHEKLILAGGLSASNIQEAIQNVQPIGVDVSSGVETDGIKDCKKIEQFTLQAKKRVTI